jgi:hypothetical protein
VGEGGPEWTENYIFFYGEDNKDNHVQTSSFFVHKRISAVTRVEFVSVKMRLLVKYYCLKCARPM